MEEAKKEKDMICDIFIKTYPADYEWLKYCCRSINKFAAGFRKTVIIAPDERHDSEGYEWQQRHEYGLGNPRFDGYLSQQVFKLNADTFSDAEFILHIDSDTIFTRPVTPETYFTNDKIDWMMTPYSMIETPWQPITEKFLGQPVEFEFMRRPPQMLPHWLYAALRERCVKRNGRTLDQYVMEQPYRAFSEYNALGAFAYYFYRDKFNWINTVQVPESEWPTLTVLQKYSHGGLTPEIVAEFEHILAQ